MGVPTFKKSIYKVQIPIFFRIMNSLRPTHVIKKNTLTYVFCPG
ncbi:conserved hypothetical protein [Leptospira interrogans serovar Manilae]|uniref:Uncharacterized protein n=3 Tax=Leptospira interrogans TaxID=173 RepID=A0AAQ1NU13_LEPIR|nr:hypothetical protein LEP1GSC148_1681 [Leptospira interrogans serovar Canicola str. LT1962]EMM79355.1 hypothetical protein LEP1GSC037_3767 [Leptospira interrogans str. 2006001854]EMM95471.1 hypothetical protein LEP1GSC158_0749 [Leptospira interrogans serovar Zanoni str. LT2156]SOR60054.1 conserved hypothetical protein [Leptospira interrogans serovar Manilae]